MPRNLFQRNFLMLAGMLLLSLLILGAAFFSFTYRGLRLEHMILAERTAGVAVDLAEAAIANGSALDSSNMRIGLVSLARISGNRIQITDPDGIVISCSDAELICEHIGQPYSDFAPGAYTEAFSQGLAVAYHLPGLSFGADIYWFSIVKVFAAVSLIVLAIALGAAYLLTKRQVRPFLQMEKAVEQAEVARRDFMANVSHELKTPITAIAGFADALQDGIVPEEKIPRYLAAISDETSRLNRLIGRLLDVTRYDSLNYVKKRDDVFDINELIRGTLIAMEGAPVAISPLLPSNPIRVRGDADAISQVLHNLLDNAVKFSDIDSSVRVKLWKEERKAYVSVRNTGVPINPEDLPHIFDRFYKPDKSRSLDKKGLGLGLHIVRSIIDAHGETISVTSIDGVTEFVFTLTVDL
ncbi:MAG: cell wall metabolism sensor histidine kinase WalK [Oscillospiraceae bacterium]|jgi:signal transduction histidine kinase|nr:cell wall metabolism sensor histidine kinase WalK [Oscillospiraceae bacterium]